MFHVWKYDTCYLVENLDKMATTNLIALQEKEIYERYRGREGQSALGWRWDDEEAEEEYVEDIKKRLGACTRLQNQAWRGTAPVTTTGNMAVVPT